MALSFDSLTAAQIAAGVSAGDFTATEVAQASLAAIEAREGGVQAFLQVAPELALEAAARVDANRAAGKPLPPLAGVPLAIKDNMNLVGTRTTCASRMLEDYQSVYTATCVQRMLDAGCLPMGKANMDEFAFGSSTESSAFHRTNNPWDTERVPGGSSGGSAAAVAAGEVALSLGSDTGGSIRQPASLCGVVGFKPTYGAVSRYGVVAFGSSLDQVGPFGRTVEDVALAMNALTGAGHDPYDCTSQDCAVDFTEHLNDSIEGKRVGIIPAFMEAEGLTPEVKAAVQRAAQELQNQGAELSGGRLRQPVRPEFAVARPRLWCRGQAPSDARCLPAELGRVRQVLLRRAKGPHAHHAGLRRRVCQGGHHPHARLAAHGL